MPQLIVPRNQNELVATFSRKKVLAHKPLEDFITKVERTDYVSLSCRVQFRGGVTRYIPMIDVKITHSSESLSAIVAFVQQVCIKFDYSGEFLIYESTNSYYLMGTKTFDLSQMLKFLAFASLSRVETKDMSHPILINDLEFFGYTLLKSFDNGLRIRSQKSTDLVPHVIKVITPSHKPKVGKRQPMGHIRKVLI